MRFSIAPHSTPGKVWFLLTPSERRGAVVLLGLMVIGMALETLGIGLVIPVIGLLSRPDFAVSLPRLQPVLAALGSPSHETIVVGAMLVLAGVYFLKALFLSFLAWRQSCFAFSVLTQLSQRLFSIYLSQPYVFHLQRNSAQLIRNVASETGVFVGGTVVPGMALVTETLVLLGLSTLLLIVEPFGALLAASILGAASWVVYFLSRRHILRWGMARHYHDGLCMQHLQEGLGGVKDVKLLGRESEFLERYRLHTVQSSRMGQLNQVAQQFPRLWLEMIGVAGLAALVLAMLAQGQRGEAILPTLGVFAIAALRLLPSVGRMLGALQSVRYSLPVIDTLYDDLKRTAPATGAFQDSATPFSEVLELRQVAFCYPGAQTPALRELSLTVRCGETVGFIGASGAGKSTLVDILLGLLIPDAGEVFVDGRNVQLNLRHWQDQVGYVPQSIFLTDDTLCRNVAFGLPNEQIDDAAVQRAIKAAQLEEFVASLPEGLDSIVGERGIRLSGGQRQRIGIARALYHDPAVLVLDEATSSLDALAERGVMQAITALQGSKTILIVAHRLSTVENCNRLYRLHEGRVVEEGTPKTMLASKVTSIPPSGKLHVQ